MRLCRDSLEEAEVAEQVVPTYYRIYTRRR
jgi:hypothetical protein